MRDDRPSTSAAGPVPEARPAYRHWAGFIASGLLAFATDACILEVSVRLFGAAPLVARLAGIACAMVVGWLAHRRWTFVISSPPTLAEFLHYALAGWIAASINYTLFAVQLLIIPEMPLMVALVIASVAAMIFSYLAMRYSVFKPR